MANPQQENGHTRIANEIMDRLAMLNLSGREWQVLMVIFRKTYGFNKKTDTISLTKFEEFTGIKANHIAGILKKLAQRHILVIDKKTYITSYGFNKNYDQWVLPKMGVKPLPKQGTPENGRGVLPKMGVKPLPKTGDTKAIKQSIQNIAANAAVIQIKNHRMFLDEITDDPIGDDKTPKSKYGRKTMMLFARRYLEAAGIRLRPGATYDANKISKGLSKLYRELLDPDLVLDMLSIAGRYFKQRKLDWTPEAAWRNLEKIQQWHDEGEPGPGAERRPVDVAERRRL